MKQFAQPLSVIGITWSLFQVYAAFASPPLNNLVALPIHVTFALAVTFVAFPFIKSKRAPTDDPEAPPPKAVPRWWDFLLAVLSLGCGLYLLSQADRLISRIPGVGLVTGLDIFAGSLVILLVLEAARRLTGLAMTAVAVVFLLYQFSGQWIAGVVQTLPGLAVLVHRGKPSLSFLREVVDLQIMQNQGVYGQATQVSFDAVFYFIFFGSFLQVSGAGQLFMDFALRLVGRFRGGPAKVAIVSSSLFGMISGSAVANVVGSGVFTIPLMKRIGYPGAFAGAVEAVASTGGQIMPPVMGAGAFMMAMFLGVPYSRIILAAAIPAVIYYAAVYFMVDFKAAAVGLRGLKEHEIGVTWGSMLRRLYLAIPLVLLVYLIIAGRSLMVTSMYTIGTILAIMVVRDVLVPALRPPGPWQALWQLLITTLKAFDVTARQAIQVAIPCATAGIIVGVVTNTGLGVKFTSLVLTLSGGSQLLALMLIMVALIIMGMGMPTTSAYLMGMILAVPALTQLNIPPLSAHMFIFYFACLSMLTPPVALAAYAASSIAESDIWETGWMAFRMSLAGFMVPYAFVYSPALLFDGALSATIWNSLTALLGAAALAGGIVGHFLTHNRKWESALLLLAAPLLIDPHGISDYLGLTLFCAIGALQFVRRRAAARSELKPATAASSGG